MSDEAMEMFPDAERAEPGIAKALRDAFDAGRASRDAEVAAAWLEQRAAAIRGAAVSHPEPTEEER